MTTATNGTEIAQTIWQQMGGRRLSAMTGARNFVATGNGLKFRFSGYRPANVAMIELNGYDLYDLTLYKIRGVNVETAYQATNLYAEDLQRVFSDATGLALRI